MHTLLVAYDAQADLESSLIDLIRHYPCARLTESAYAINTKHSPAEVFEKLEAVTGGDGSLYVIPLDAPAVGHGPHYVHNLLATWLAGEAETERKPRQPAVGEVGDTHSTPGIRSGGSR